MGGRLVFGGVAQLVRACGSYPQCPEFESLHRHHIDEAPFLIGWGLCCSVIFFNRAKLSSHEPPQPLSE